MQTLSIRNQSMKNFLTWCIVAGWIAILCTPALGQPPVPGLNRPVIRGKAQEVYYYRAVTTGPAAGIVLYGSGDAGMRGAAVNQARSIAGMGYDVYGFDVKEYLESFTGNTTLKVNDVMSDFRTLARWILQGGQKKVILAGWSEGAGLCLLGAAAPENRDVFAGLLAIGLAEDSFLGWRLIDDLTYITRKNPNEPIFLSVDYLSRVSPLPLVMIQATQDRYITPEKARQLFDTAREPKRFILLESRDHRFDGDTKEFEQALQESLKWIGENGR
jgi:fermentation-respiration switch protein FrsA (DUF1100 family)